MSTITTRDGTKIYVKVSGEGRPAVLIHGWPLSADSWDYQAMLIAEAGFQVITYDRRGFGRSDQTWSGYDYDTLADDLADVIKETGVDNATIIGFSMGGGEVARYMSRYKGEKIAQAGLISSVVPFMLKTSDNPQGVDSSVFAEMISGIKKDRPQFFEGFFKDFFGVGMLSKPVSDEYLLYTRNIALQGSLKATIDCVKAFSSTDFRNDLSSITVPTLIIHGTSDNTVPIDISSRIVAKQLPHATFHEYENAPHGLLATHQDQVANDIIKFLRSAN